MTQQAPLSWYPKPDGGYEHHPGYNAPEAWKKHGPTGDWETNKRRQERAWWVEHCIETCQEDPRYELVWDDGDITGYRLKKECY